MNKWIKYSYVCPDCDALIEHIVKPANIPNYIFMFDYKCVCGGEAVRVSVVDATIYPTKEKEEQQMEQESKRRCRCGRTALPLAPVPFQSSAARQATKFQK